jgi:hypothetical protein
MTDRLDLAELEMSAAAADAAVRQQVALGWLRAADAELTALERPTWGGVVDSWHRAAEALADSSEAVAAYRAFSDYDSS